MASVSVSHVILFIAAVAVAAMVAGTATGIADDVSGALRDAGHDYEETLDTDFSIISDPGANAIYNASETTVTLLVKNTGSRVLSTDPAHIDVLVDGRLVPEISITVLDGDYWRPGNVARITLNTTIGDGAHRVIVRSNERRSLLTFPFYGSASGSGDVVFAGSLETISRDGGDVTTYLSQRTPPVIGPAKVDFDGDGSLGAPYVNSSGVLKIVDVNSITVLRGEPAGSASKLAVGTWNGSEPSVFFGNSSGLYRVRPGTAPVQIDTQKTGAVAGIADFDGDGADELVFLGGSANVYFLDQDGTITNTGTTVGSSMNAIGAPKDFDGDGRARMPFVDSSGYVSLFGYDSGSVTTPRPNTATKASKLGVGGHDVDGDGQLEIVFVTTEGTLAYMELDGTITEMTNSTGATISVTSPGVA